MTEEYIVQVSEEIEGSVTKKLSQDFSRMESRILGTLSKLDEFFWTRKYGLAPEPFREHPGITTQKTGNPLGIVAWMIPTSKWTSLFVRPALQLTQTGRRLLKKTFLNVSNFGPNCTFAAVKLAKNTRFFIQHSCFVIQIAFLVAIVSFKIVAQGYKDHLRLPLRHNLLLCTRFKVSFLSNNYFTFRGSSSMCSCCFHHFVFEELTTKTRHHLFLIFATNCQSDSRKTWNFCCSLVDNFK